MRVLVVGAGAVGGYFGARLSQSGRDVTFLARGERAKQLNADGVRLVSSYGNLTTPVNVLTADELNESFDLIFLSVKGFALQQAIHDIASAIGPSTVRLCPFLCPLSLKISHNLGCVDSKTHKGGRW